MGQRAGQAAHPAQVGKQLPGRRLRLWRDAGFAAGALLAGLLADAFGIRAAVWAVAALTAASGVVVAVRLPETHRRLANAPGPAAPVG